MNCRTVLPVTFVAALFILSSQAQTVATPAPSGATSTEGLNVTSGEVPVPAPQVSEDSDTTNTIRIVRLSQTSGKVELDRNIGQGFEGAFNNLPITQGARLRTGEGCAEVEFEDGTTLRLTPSTEVDFTELSRSDTGATRSSMRVLAGTVYVSLNKTKGNTFELTSGDGVISPRPGAHLRLEVKDLESRLSVISGSADFVNTSGSQEVGKMKSLIFNTATHAPADLIAGVEDVPFDSWDEEQAEYHKRYSRGNALAGSGSAYGLADLNYYGSFADVDGCGRIWRPYFVSAGWDPYASGVWALYPGSGYSWVSPYPWGWAPFHYGSWLQCGGSWGWQPGGAWYGLAIRDMHRDAGHHHPRGPIHVHPFPIRPHPIEGKVSSMIAVNHKPLIFSRPELASDSFNFRNDSAGLGVPRGAFGKLSKLSDAAGKSGSTSIPVSFTHPNGTELSPASGGGRDNREPGLRVADHTGYFVRPNGQIRDGNNTYADRRGGNLPEPPRGGNSSYASAPRGINGSGYSGGRAPSGGYNGGALHASGNGGGYAGGSHVGGGSYSGGNAGAAHVSAPASSAPAPSAHR